MLNGCSNGLAYLNVGDGKNELTYMLGLMRGGDNMNYEQHNNGVSFSW